MTQGHSSTAGAVSCSSLAKSRASKLLAPDVDEAAPPCAFSHLFTVPDAGSWYGDSLKDELLGNDLGDSECSPRLGTVPVAGKVMAKDVKAGPVKTLQGKTIMISTTNGVMVNDAKVVKTDIEASNGVIHVIDTVLMP